MGCRHWIEPAAGSGHHATNAAGTNAHCRARRSGRPGGRDASTRARVRATVATEDRHLGHTRDARDRDVAHHNRQRGRRHRAIGRPTARRRGPRRCRRASRPWRSGEIVVVASSGRLVALDAASGTTKWTAERVGDPTSLIAHADAVIAASGSEIRAWSTDGRDAWRQQLDAAIVTPLAADGDLLFAGLASRKIVALDAKTGAPRWVITLETTARALLATRRPALLRRRRWRVLRVPSAGRSGMGVAVTPRSLPVIGLPTADDRRLYVTFLDNTVRAFDLAIGNQRWQRPITSRPAAGPFLTDALIGVPTTSGTVILLRRTDGALPAPASAARCANDTRRRAGRGCRPASCRARDGRRATGRRADRDPASGAATYRRPSRRRRTGPPRPQARCRRRRRLLIPPPPPVRSRSSSAAKPSSLTWSPPPPLTSSSSSLPKTAAGTCWREA